MNASVAIIPCYNAAPSVGAIIDRLQRMRPELPVIVVDDGSTDASARRAGNAGALVLSHRKNLGKGAALKTGLRKAAELGATLAVSLDADGQHPPEEAIRLLEHPVPVSCLLLGVRNLVQAQAPRPNRFSNRFSNLALSAFSGRRLLDTQCGLRRYPVLHTLSLGVRSDGYAFEAEVILRAARKRWQIEHLAVKVLYPAGSGRLSHFHAARDPAKIVLRVLHTVATAPRESYPPSDTPESPPIGAGHRTRRSH